MKEAVSFTAGNAGRRGPAEVPRQRHIDNWRLWLRDLRRREDTVNAERTEAVMRARAEGESWATIARHLGVSKPAAYKRYREPDEQRRADERNSGNG